MGNTLPICYEKSTFVLPLCYVGKFLIDAMQDGAIGCCFDICCVITA
jgi:hypothetical protein